jgi:hypothetical protein
MKHPRANPSRIPSRPASAPVVETTDNVPRVRTGRLTALRWQKSLSGIPWLGRLLIATIIALATTMMIFPQVDAIYLDYFFNENTIVVASLVSAGVGLMMYMAGWMLIVGSRSAPPEEQVSSSPALLWYIGFGVLALVLCTVLLLHGLTLTDTLAG